VGQKKAFWENEAKTLRYINMLKILRADLITRPAFMMAKAAEECGD
jgi:hypothetical protein